MHIIVDSIITVVFLIHSITKGHIVLIVMKNDLILNIKHVLARPKRLRLRKSVSPFSQNNAKPTLVMSRARLGIRQSIEDVSADGWGIS